MRFGERHANHQIIKSSNHQIIKSSNHQIIKNSVKIFARLSSALVVSTLLLAGSNSWAATTDYTITSTNAFTPGTSPLGGVSECNFSVPTSPHYYASQQFTVSTSGSYTIETIENTAGTGTINGDTFLAIYNVAFNPAAPTVGLVACNDDNGSNFLSRIATTLSTGITYTAVITAWAPSLEGFVTLSYPTGVVSGAATGGSGGSTPVTGGSGGSTPVTGGSGGSTPVTGGSGGSTPVNAPIDLRFSKQVETYSTDIELK